MNNLTLVHRFVKTAPRKLQAVSRLVTGKTLTQARQILAIVNKRAAKTLSGYLQSAQDAVKQKNMLPEDVKIFSVSVSRGPVAKRWLPRARGRVSRFQRKTSHMTIKLKLQTQKSENLAKPASDKKSPAKNLAQASTKTKK